MKTNIKLILTFIFLLVLQSNSFSQNVNDTLPPQKASLEDALRPLEQMPTFVGGEDSMKKFIQTNINRPEEAVKKGIKGTCYVQFIVEQDGSLTDVKVVRGIKGGQMLDDEALRVVKLMPKWNPGKRDGKFVRVAFNLPIKFN